MMPQERKFSFDKILRKDKKTEEPAGKPKDVYIDGVLRTRTDDDGSVEHYDQNGEWFFTTLPNGKKIWAPEKKVLEFGEGDVPDMPKRPKITWIPIETSAKNDDKPNEEQLPEPEPHQEKLITALEKIPVRANKDISSVGNFLENKTGQKFNKPKKIKGLLNPHIEENMNSDIVLEEKSHVSPEDVKVFKYIMGASDVDESEISLSKEEMKEERELLSQNIKKNVNPDIIDVMKPKIEPELKNEEKELAKEGSKEHEETIAKVAEILKNNKIDQIVIHGGKTLSIKDGEHKGEEWTQLRPDLDAKVALYLWNEFNEKSLEENYAEGAMTSIIPKTGSMESLSKKKGIVVVIDTGNNWISIEEDGETKIINIDHHGIGQKDPTSATKLMYEIMDKADLLKEKPEWIKNFVGFVNEVDNLTYLGKVDKAGQKTFDINYFKYKWPYTLYALAESIPLEDLIKLYEFGTIKDPSKSLTPKEIETYLGKIKTKDGKSVLEKCKEKAAKAIETLEGIDNAIKYAENKKINLKTKSLGSVVYHNFSKIKGKRNTIPNDMAFMGTIALGGDTYASWNQKEGKFFLNSSNPNLSKIVEKLNEADPGCASDIRGVMVFGQIKNLTEEEFLKIINMDVTEEGVAAQKIKLEATPEPATEEVNKEPENVTEEWTEEDEKTLNNLLKVIENARKRFDEIDKELLEAEELEKNETRTTSEAPKNDIKSLEQKLQDLQSEILESKTKKEENFKIIEKINEEVRKLYREADALYEKESKEKARKIGWTKRKERKTRKEEIKRIQKRRNEVWLETPKKEEELIKLNDIDIELAKQILEKEEALRIATREYESELKEIDNKKNPFKYFLIDNMNPTIFRMLFSKEKAMTTLEELNKEFGESGKEIFLNNYTFVLPERGNAVSSSSNGFFLQLQNPGEVTNEKIIDIYSPKARYELLSPEYVIYSEDRELSYENGKKLLLQKAQEYQNIMLERFNQQK